MLNEFGTMVAAEEGSESNLDTLNEELRGRCKVAGLSGTAGF